MMGHLMRETRNLEQIQGIAKERYREIIAERRVVQLTLDEVQEFSF